MRTWLAGLLMAAGLWGVIFPQYMLTSDCVTVKDENGADVTEEKQESGINLYDEIGNAEKEQVEIKISVLEWIENRI